MKIELQVCFCRVFYGYFLMCTPNWAEFSDFDNHIKMFIPRTIANSSSISIFPNLYIGTTSCKEYALKLNILVDDRLSPHVDSICEQLDAALLVGDNQALICGTHSTIVAMTYLLYRAEWKLTLDGVMDYLELCFKQNLTIFEKPSIIFLEQLEFIASTRRTRQRRLVKNTSSNFLTALVMKNEVQNAQTKKIKDKIEAINQTLPTKIDIPCSKSLLRFTPLQPVVKGANLHQLQS